MLVCVMIQHSFDWWVVVMLQNNPDLLKVVPSSCCETCLTTSEDGNEIISIKEETSDTQEGEVPLRVSLPIIMAKSGVSHVRMLIIMRITVTCIHLFS